MAGKERIMRRIEESMPVKFVKIVRQFILPGWVTTFMDV